MITEPGFCKDLSRFRISDALFLPLPLSPPVCMYATISRKNLHKWTEKHFQKSALLDTIKQLTAFHDALWQAQLTSILAQEERI